MAYATTLTNGGKDLIRNALLGEGIIKFTSLMLGSGTPPADASGMTALVSPESSAAITEMTRDANYFVRIETRYNNTGLSTGFRVTELGLYAKGSEEGTPILYAYVGITDGDGGYIPPEDSILIERDYTISVFVGDAVDVSAETTSAGYATLGDLASHNASDSAHENLFSLKQDRTDLLPAASSLMDNDVIPTYNATDGHKKSPLSVLVNFIKTTLSGSSDFLPIVPVSKGGTGRSSLTSNSVLLGNGTSAVYQRTSSKGAFYSTGSGVRPVFGTLPTDVGGTGNADGYIRKGLASGVTAGTGATAEGNGTSPTGSYAHAEGDSCVAYGDNSHAEGKGTIANSRSQHVFGEFNIGSTQSKSVISEYAEIVGGGTSTSDRKNIRTLGWDGTETLAGNLLPSGNAEKDVGSTAKKWKNIFADKLYGKLSGKVTFNNSGSGASSGSGYEGDAALTVSYNTIGAAAASHTHSPANITTDGTLGAKVSAKASMPLGDKVVRNIYAGTTDMTPGTSALAYGTIYLVYE